MHKQNVIDSHHTGCYSTIKGNESQAATWSLKAFRREAIHDGASK